MVSAIGHLATVTAPAEGGFVVEKARAESVPDEIVLVHCLQQSQGIVE